MLPVFVLLATMTGDETCTAAFFHHGAADEFQTEYNQGNAFATLQSFEEESDAIGLVTPADGAKEISATTPLSGPAETVFVNMERQSQ